jgi:hypothetical protein
MAPYKVCDMYWVKVGLGSQKLAAPTRIRRYAQRSRKPCSPPLLADSQYTYWERASKSACASANNTNSSTVTDCPAGQSVYAFTATDTTLLDTSSGSAYPSATSADACASACTKNQGLNGKPCQMSLFDGTACTLFTTPPDMPTSQAYAKKTGSTITLKYCIDQSKLPANCKGPAVVRPNIVLVGLSAKAVTVSTMSDCIAACASEKSFKCASGAFFHDVKDNCVLNIETAATKPSQVNDDPRDMLYFETKC